MQYRQSHPRIEQAELFHNALMASRSRLEPLTTPGNKEALTSNEDAGGFSEISLNGAPHHCLQWLAPVLRELSQARTPGWLTLVDPPEAVSHSWLRQAGLDPWRILIVRSKTGMDSFKLTCELLRLGYSHTVVSWHQTSQQQAALLENAARSGSCRSLNVRMESTQAAA